MSRSNDCAAYPRRVQGSGEESSERPQGARGTASAATPVYHTWGGRCELPDRNEDTPADVDREADERTRYEDQRA